METYEKAGSTMIHSVYTGSGQGKSLFAGLWNKLEKEIQAYNLWDW